MDEIPTGLGKTGRMFAFEHNDVMPDIVKLGKALGGGVLPIVACIAHRDLDVCGDFAVGHDTNEKNPLTARAALTTIEILEEEGLVERSAQLGVHVMERLQISLAGCPIVGAIRGRGLMFGIEIVADKSTKAPGADLAEQIFYACLDAGVSKSVRAVC